LVLVVGRIVGRKFIVVRLVARRAMGREVAHHYPRS
jgi:hypothetical protein